MQIHLRINLGETSLTVDDALVQQALPEPLASQIRAPEYLGGEIEFSAEGQKPLRIPDDLEQLVPRLCLQTLSSLEAGVAVTVPLLMDPGQVKLEVAGDQLSVATPDGRRESYPLAAALAELEACGARFARLLELNFPDDASLRRKLTAMQLILFEREDERSRNSPPPELPDWDDDAET